MQARASLCPRGYQSTPVGVGLSTTGAVDGVGTAVAVGASEGIGAIVAVGASEGIGAAVAAGTSEGVGTSVVVGSCVMDRAVSPGRGTVGVEGGVEVSVGNTIVAVSVGNAVSVAVSSGVSVDGIVGDSVGDSSVGVPAGSVGSGTAVSVGSGTAVSVGTGTAVPVGTTGSAVKVGGSMVGRTTSFGMLVVVAGAGRGDGKTLGLGEVLGVGEEVGTGVTVTLTVGDVVGDGRGSAVIVVTAVRPASTGGTIGVRLPWSSVYRYQITSQTVAIKVNSVTNAT